MSSHSQIPGIRSWVYLLASPVTQAVKNLPAAGDLGLILELGYPLQYSCLESPMHRGAWQATVHGVTKNGTQLSNFTFDSLEGLMLKLKLQYFGYLMGRTDSFGKDSDAGKD